MSKKQSLLMPLQGLRRRIPACSPGDLPASEIWGDPQRGQGHPCPALGGARVQPGAALLATGVGRRAENFWEAGEGGMSLLPSSLLGADIYFHISMHKLSLCQSREGGMEMGLQELEVHGLSPAQLPPASPAC